MHLRKVVLASIFASALVANVASALGLGEIKLKSTLNQPLNAEIQLLDTRDLNANQILVALGSPADFERSGVERSFFYTEFRFEVVFDNPGGAVIRVTTQVPVREPYLNFLVEARWSAGRLLREYTLLMDLPTFNEAAPQAVEAPQTTTSSNSAVVPDAPRPIERVPVVAPQPVETPTTAPVAEETTPAQAPEESSPKKPKLAAGTYGPITQGETLWEIALAVRPDSSVSVYQTMMALQRLNPDAFIRSNVNLIKKGQVLRIPDSSEISSLSHKDALAEFNSQTSEWSALVNNASNAEASPSSTNLAPELDATRHKATNHTSQEPAQGRVKLAAPGSSEAGTGQGNGANKGKGKALEKDLAATLEELDKAKSENSELNSRVNSLETQTKTMQKLVDVSNDKLRAMQVNAAKNADAKKSAASSVAVSSAAADVSSVAVSSAAKASAPAIKKPEPAKVKAPEPSIVDMLMDNLTWIALGLLVVILGVIFFRSRSKTETRNSSVAADDIFEPDASFDHFNHLQDDDHFDQLEDEAPIEEELPVEAETDDPAGESEIYISLKQYDRAEDILLKGLAKDPNSTEIRLKLLEVYSHEQNAPEFEKHYKALMPFAGAGALARAKELRANIPGLSLFDESESVPKAAVRPSTFVEEKPLAEAKEIPVRSSFTPVSSPAVTDDDLIDIDLDLDDDHSSDFDTTEAERFSVDLSDDGQAHQAEEDSDFSFDLDLDSPAHEKPEELAEDLSHISLAIDDMDEKSVLPNLDLETSEAAEDDEEFSFDFNELDDEPEPTPAKSVDVPAKTSAPAAPASDDASDDFDLEMEMDDVDLAALDREMESLDADLDASDLAEAESTAQSRNFEKLRAALDDVDDTEVDDEFDQNPLDIDHEPISEPVESSPTKIRKFDLATEPMTVEDSHEDDVFNEALSDFNSDEFSAENSAGMTDEEMDSELDFMADADEAATKLDLARAYIDMGDNDGARDILAEVVLEGNEQQKSEAEQLLGRIGHT